MKYTALMTIDSNYSEQQICAALVKLLADLTLDDVGKLNVTCVTVWRPRRSLGKANWKKEK